MCKFSANFAFNKATYEPTNRYKTQNVMKNLALKVISADLFSIAPILAKVEFGNAENVHIVVSSPIKWRSF